MVILSFRYAHARILCKSKQAETETLESYRDILLNWVSKYSPSCPSHSLILQTTARNYDVFKVQSCARLVHLLELFCKVTTNASKPDPSQPQIAHLSGTIHSTLGFWASSLVFSVAVPSRICTLVVLGDLQSSLIANPNTIFMCCCPLHLFQSELKIYSQSWIILFFHNLWYSTASNFPASSDILHGLCTMVIIIIILVQTTQ